jgi:hypothetical protein
MKTPGQQSNASSARKGMPSPKLEEEEFKTRYLGQFEDPAFRSLDSELSKIAEVAWQAYAESRKSPITRKAGEEFTDPDYELSVDWLAARDAIHAAQARHDAPCEKTQILLINASSRSEHTCPGEMSKSYRLVELERRRFRN